VGAKDYKFYHVGNKPSAADTNAVGLTGNQIMRDSLTADRFRANNNYAYTSNLRQYQGMYLGNTDADRRTILGGGGTAVGDLLGSLYLRPNGVTDPLNQTVFNADGTIENNSAPTKTTHLTNKHYVDGRTQAEATGGLLMRVGGTRDEEIRSALAGATGGAYMSETPPPNPFPGARWFDTNEGRTFLWYVDDDSSQWVEENPQSADETNSSPIIVQLASEGTLDVADGKKNAITVNNGSSISYQDQGHAVFHNFADGNGIEWAHGNNGENTIMVLDASGTVHTNGPLYSSEGHIVESRDLTTWISMEASSGVSPYIATRSPGEGNVSKTIEFLQGSVKFNKPTHNSHTRITADGGLQFAPSTTDLSGITWGMGVNPNSRTLGVYQYNEGAYAGAVWDVNNSRNVHFHGGVSIQASLLCVGGSESSYHQVKNSGNPSLELHEPGIAAAMVYKPQGTNTVRFARSNGAGGEQQGYGGADVDGFFTVSGRYRAVYQAANRSWTAVGSTPFYAEGISVSNGSFRSIVGGYSVIPGAWSLESTYGVYCENSAETTSHVLQMTDGGGFNRFWRFANGGNLYSPTNWHMESTGVLHGTAFGGYVTMINWCTSSFAPASDEKLKKNIQPSTRSALENVAKIKFHSYEWVDGKSKETNLGMIAQELEKIDPSYTRDIETFNVDGSVDTSVKALDTANLLALALKSIQELEARIKELEEKVNG
ncbi:MAG: tail fiber domain-containing protein, partial [Bacteroidales bacterium]